jgi:hypothetical protein
MLETAQRRVAATEAKADNMAWLGYEPMEVNAFTRAPKRPRPSETSTIDRDLHLL